MAKSRTYSIVLEPMPEGGSLVHVPAMPEVVTCGDDEVEALAMAQEAIELVIASRLERGEPIPEDAGEPQVRRIVVALAA